MKRSHLILFNFVALGIIVVFQACTQGGLTTITSDVVQSLSPPSAQGIDEGHEHGNGGDDVRFAKAAWFVDSGRTIQYCVQLSSDFAVPQDQVLKQVQSTFAVWTNFMKQSHTYSVSMVSKSFSLADDCNHADLRLLFGGPNPHYNPSKIGAVFRESIDVPNNWSQGYLWVSTSGANWSESFRLTGALLHLEGEILGFGNVSGTILDNQWDSWLVANPTPELEQKLTMLENDRRLAGSLDVIKANVSLNPQLKLVFGVTPDQVPVVVDIANLKMTVQSNSLRFVTLYSRSLKHGDFHRIAYINKTPLYNFMKTIPQILESADATQVFIIQFLDLPGRPQLILELNGDQAVRLSSL